ncbi:hypothetical protein Fmac_032309 [Flemingia macrophylla]|uniref:Nucleobase-ascorbate transporter 10 n=1 Tax=Flemingia macrophylla TaxID=520843 RepID=A0ABD1L4I5_9FABA
MAQDNSCGAPDNNGGGGGAVKKVDFEPHPVQEQLAGVQYCVKSPPPWGEAVVLGFQHYLLTLGMTVLIPTILVPQMGGGDEEKSKVIQSLLLVTGISTCVQSLCGTRLPIVVVGSCTYIVPLFSIIEAKRYTSFTDPYERFTNTMRGIQGALIISGCFQFAFGFFGFWRVAVRFLSPLCVVPYVTFTGLSLYRLGFPMLAKCVEIGLPTLVIFVFCSQASIYHKCYIITKKPICERFSVLITVSITWLFALFLTSCTAYNKKPESTQHSCRTDRAGLVSTAPWVYFRFFFPWGPPTFNAGEGFAVAVASFVSLFEYTGTCYAAARYGSATPVPPSVISRGAGWLGVGAFLSGVVGSVTGFTASVENAGLLGLTKVGSRRVIQISSGFMIFFSIFASAGLDFLQFCNLNNFRNKFVLGFSFFLGISIPQYFSEYYNVKQHHGVPRWFHDTFTVFFMSHTTVAALVAFVLDLTLAREDDAARKDSGLQWWERFNLYSSNVKSDEFYSLPFRILNKAFPPN